MADSVDVAAMAEAALAQYISVAGGLFKTPPGDLPQGVRPLSRTIVPFPSREGGLLVLDLFSGVGTTLLSLLRTRTKVRRYFSVKTISVARQVQRAAWEGPMAAYPLLCNRDTFRQCHGDIPNDVQLLGVDILASLPEVDRITAGWECQGHSRAGHGKGLRDHRTALFYDLVCIIALCQEKNNPEVGYLLAKC